MATPTAKPDIDASQLDAIGMPHWPAAGEPSGSPDLLPQRPTQLEALQALLAFSSLHEQIRRRRALAARQAGFDSQAPVREFEPAEQFVLDDVLRLVAERAVAITGADGLAIALAENNEIVLRAAAGTIRPDVGQRIDRNSSFSGACFRTAQIFNCDDTETDSRVNLEACRKLGARSMVAVPLCGRRRVIGILEAFSSWPFGFNDSDVRNLTLLAELILAALKPEDEDRFAESAQVAASKLEPAKPSVPTALAPASSAEKKTSIVAAPAKPDVVQPAAATAPAVTQPSLAAASEPASKAQPAVLPYLRGITPEAGVKPSKPEDSKETSPSLQPKAEQKVEPVESKGKASGVVEPALMEAVATEPLEHEADAVSVASEPGLVSQRQWMLVLLVCIVVGTAFAAGVWWKLKSAQISNQMVQSVPRAQQQETPAAAAKTTAQTADTGTNLSPNFEPAVSSDSSSTPQELSKFPKVTSVRHWSSADSSTVVLDLEDQVQYEPGHLSNPDRFYFDLRDTQLAAELAGKSLDGDSLLNRIRIAQPAPGVTRVVLEAKPGAALSRPQVSLERDPYRLVIEISKAGASPKAAVNLFPTAPEAEKSKLSIVVPPPTKEDLQLRARVPKMRIVVDAGHGGWDLGTVGRRGLLEKDLVLEIAQRLGKLLESRLGADVIYTRQDDNYIPLEDRAQIANQAQADLFISVHANYSDLPSARGVETYYTSFFSAPGSKELPFKDVDTHGIGNAPKNSAPPALTGVELHDRIEQSRRLAASVQRALYGALSVQNPGLRDRGVKEAGFVVLTDSAMPGILAEVSFVSSPADEQKLRSDGYREQIAEALYKGIGRYAANSRGVKLAAK